MRGAGFILLVTLGVLGCSGRHLGMPMGGGGAVTSGAAGRPGDGGGSGVAGTGATPGVGGTLGVGGNPGTGGTPGTGGNAGGMLSLIAGNLKKMGPPVRFNSPFGMFSDGAGTLYVTDDPRISKVDVATGEVTTLAGDVTQSGTDDGTGAAARFNDPEALVGDGAGNLYVADTRNQTIRKIVIATGKVTTLAGVPGSNGFADGKGAAAVFFSPSGITIDGAGNLYVSDTYNNCIRKIVIATATVSTLATVDGTGAAFTFNSPTGIGTDGAGNLYLVDAGAAIRKIAIATGVVTTLAQDGLNGPCYVTSGGAGSVYVTQSDGTIVKVATATGIVTPFAGTSGQTRRVDGTGAAGLFGWPNGIAPDGAGNLYVSDTASHAVRKIVIATADVSTLFCPGCADGVGVAAFFNSPAGIASDGAGAVYVADSGNHVIRKVVIATGAVTAFAGMLGEAGGADGTGTDARFSHPYGIASDGAGSLFVADSGNDTIRKVVLATAAVTTVAGTAGAIGSADGTGAAARFSTPIGLASDGGGNLYIADSSNHTIRKLAIATGAVTTVAGMPGQAGSADGTSTGARFDNPGAVAVDGAGDLCVADAGNSTIRKLVIATGAVTTLAGVAGQSGSADGNGASARFMYPYGIAGDGAGNLYVADTGNGTVRKVVTASGSVSTLIGSPGQLGVVPGPLPASVNTPYGVVVLPTGGIGVTDFSQNAVLVGSL